MTIEEMKSNLMQTLSPTRYQHSIGVMEEARKLAAHYKADAKKAEIAGLLHDCAKYIQNAEVVRLLQHYGVALDEIQKSSPWILHGPLGFYIARENYDVTDTDILNAIYWHTTGKAGMNLLEKIVYVADYTESGRCLDGAEEARIVAYQDLDRCILLCTEMTIRYVLQKGFLLHPYTVQTRNDALMRLAQRCCSQPDGC